MYQHFEETTQSSGPHGDESIAMWLEARIWSLCTESRKFLNVIANWIVEHLGLQSKKIRCWDSLDVVRRVYALEVNNEMLSILIQLVALEHSQLEGALASSHHALACDPLFFFCQSSLCPEHDVEIQANEPRWSKTLHLWLLPCQNNMLHFFDYEM